MDLKALGLRIKELREKAELTQKELADKAGVSQRAISHWEQGLREPGLGAAQALAAALGVDCRAFQVEAKDAAPRGKGRPKK